MRKSYNRVSHLIALVVVLFGIAGWLALPSYSSGRPAASSAFAVDLTVANIEVTQAIQTPTNTIRLVAQRSTAVRATVGVSGSSGPVSGVTGRLHVFVDGTEITPAAGRAPIKAPFTAQLSPQRANEDDTLNFELPAPTGITASTNVKFRVDITPVPGEMDTTNNSGEVTLAFVNRITPLLYFTSINHTPSGRGLPDSEFIKPGVGDAFVQGILPVNEAEMSGGEMTLYRQGLFSSLDFNQDDGGDGVIGDSSGTCNPECAKLLALLASCRQLIVDMNSGASDRIFLYGWVKGNVGGNGWATKNGRVAFGNTEEKRGQRSYAHELTHNFGLEHDDPALSLDEVGWDVGARLVNNPTTNNTTDRVKLTSFFNIQTPGKFTNEAWVHTGKYNFLLDSRTLMLGDDPDDPNPFSRRIAVIQGIFDPSGERLLSFRPVYRFPWLSQRTRRPLSGNYAIEIVDSAQNVFRTLFDALVADDGDNEQERPGFFEVMVPVLPEREINMVRITDAAGLRVFGVRTRSAPPQIRILVPQAGTPLGARSTVIWETADPDTPQNQLVYQVAYSPNNGQSFVPLAVDVQGNSATFDTDAIQRSQGTGLIRVFVSDGLNTAFADVSGLTVLDANCDKICFRSPQYFLLNPLVLRPGETVVIGGVNLNVPTRNLVAIQLALRGGASPLHKLNQQFVAAQLSIIKVRGHSSPGAFSARNSPLSCYDLPRAGSIRLSNGFMITSGLSLNELFAQTLLAIRENRTADMLALANLFAVLNGNDPLGRCGR